jgi:hypothetical protein
MFPQEDPRITTPRKATALNEVSGISITQRIPDFWQDQPRLWFIQIEAILAPQKSSDETNYQTVITKLGKAELEQVSDIITNPPETKKYDVLKTRLLQIFEETETRRLQKLLGEMDLGDSKPSQLLRKMKDLARDKMPEETLRILWTQHLPIPVKAALAILDQKTLNETAEAADKVFESTTNMAPQVNSMQTAGSDLQEQIASLQLQISELLRERGRSRQRSTSRSSSPTGYRPRNRSQSRTPDFNRNGICYYHARFGDRAWHCKDKMMCKYSNSSAGNYKSDSEN